MHKDEGDAIVGAGLWRKVWSRLNSKFNEAELNEMEAHQRQQAYFNAMSKSIYELIDERNITGSWKSLKILKKWKLDEDDIWVELMSQLVDQFKRYESSLPVGEHIEVFQLPEGRTDISWKHLSGVE